MIGFFRFVTPYFFQKKWDDYFFKNQDTVYADEQLKLFCKHLGDVFVKTFKKLSLYSLRCMDAKPMPVKTIIIANEIIKKDVKVLGLIVRGDCLFNPDLQFDYYKKLKQHVDLKNNTKNQVSIHICQNHIRGHDHFLSEEFSEDVKIITNFLWAI